ncbi:MAG TPA: hypothetical protein V6C72_01140, partial [Chroococcales cyanobacterium]
MSVKAHAPVLAILTSLIAGGVLATPSLAQSAGLPPTNMGKFVHQPGDNQYSQQTQSERHAPPPQMAAPRPMFNAGGGGGGGWQPTPPPHREDISLLPIAADEPIAPAGFPPLPDRLDIPGVVAGFGGGGGTGYGGAAGMRSPSAPGGASMSQPQLQGVHQGYGHY